jgi:glycosyltransferase involved in cell wall biosynthesis
MKIFHVMAGANAGGAETAYIEICIGQKQAGFDVYAICRKASRNEALRDAGIPVYELPFGGFFDFKTTSTLKKLISDIKPAVVVTWMNRAAQKLPKPKNREFKWIPRLGGYYNLKYYKGADHFVVNAPDIGRWMETQGVASEKISFIPNFADAPLDVTPTPRASLDTPDDAFLFLTLGRLHVNKAFDTLLSAMAHVPDAYLWIAGEGPERGALTTQCKALGLDDRVRFLGWRDDRWALLAACDAFVFPSRHEPFGNSFMNAWASGKPLITTASQGPSHFVRDGFNGLVTPIDDVPRLADAMNKVASDPILRESLAKAGQAAYSQAFDKKAILEQWRGLFKLC